MTILSPPKLWTVWLDYSATGEGRSIMAIVVYASGEDDARARFSEKFGEWFAQGAEAQMGVARNAITSYLFSSHALDIMAKSDGRANVIASASVHINAS